VSKDQELLFSTQGTGESVTDDSLGHVLAELCVLVAEMESRMGS
jgi:hypothetical protein